MKITHRLARRARAWLSVAAHAAAGVGTLLLLAATPVAAERGERGERGDRALDDQLATQLRRAGFGGKVQSTLGSRLGRALDPKLADLGRLLFFDTATGLHGDNTCAGCHAPMNGMGDTQSIAIGVDSNRVVGPSRTGPRNQRRSPMVLNTAFFPKLMWNGRFFAPTNDPFSNAQGFTFPAPEGTTRFLPNDAAVTHLLVAQAHIPPTETVEVAGFTGTRGTIGPRFDAFDDGHGLPVPLPDASGSRNEPIRQKVLEILNASAPYRALFGASFAEVATGAPIDFTHFARAITEFEFTLTRANAPLDRFARGERGAMTVPQKRGALVFFGKGGCVRCHAVAGASNEMFSDFTNRNIAVPQIAPAFGVGKSNMIYDGPGENEDFGAEQVSGDRNDRYKFRTAPLRNVALQPAFFHNGSFTRLADAIRHHLDPAASARGYRPLRAGVDRDLAYSVASPELALATLDPLLAAPTRLAPQEFSDLVEFVRDGLLDPAARPQELCRLIPATVPSGRRMLKFEGCPAHGPRR